MTAPPSLTLLGLERFNRISSSFVLGRIGNLLAKKGTDPELLARGIMAACRGQDTVAAMDYFSRALNLMGENLPDSVIQEMNFFIGASSVDWMRLEMRIKKNPADIDARMAQLDAGLIIGDSAQIRRTLKEMVSLNLDDKIMLDLTKKYGIIAGADPFATTNLVNNAWDGSYSADGSKIAYVKDLGDSRHPDVYLYQSNSSGGGEVPILKGVQEYIAAIVMPRYSDNGRWIYFYGSNDRSWTIGRTGKFYLYRIEPRFGSHPQKLTDADLLPVEPYFEANGTALLIRRDVGSVRSSVEVVRLSPDKRTLEVVSRIGEPVSAAAFNATGDSVIFLTDRGIFRRSITGGNITVDFALTGFQHMQMIPSSNSLFLINRAGGAVLLDRNDGHLSYLGRVSVFPGGFTKNGRYVLLTRGNKGQRSVVRLDLHREITSAAVLKNIQ